MLNEDQAQHLVIADHLGERPASFPALLAMLRGGDAVLAAVGVSGLAHAVRQGSEESEEVIEQGPMMDPGGLRLVFDHAPGPALDDNMNVPPNDLADFAVTFGAKH